jgi:glycosyltransferase involved in cell wall biosynthesis
MISIVIRTKNERGYLAEVLSAVYAQNDEEIFEVVVIDSGSTDGTQEVVKSFPARLLEIPADRFSFGYALNLGAELARGRIIVYLSAHCTPTTHGWLRNLVEPLRSDPALVATYGRQQPRKDVNPFEEPGLRLAFPEDRVKRPLALFSNANCAAWRTVLLSNPFDETLTSSEDLVWRMKFQPNQILYVPEAAVYHSHPISFKYWAKRFERDGMATMAMQHHYGLINPYISRNDTFAAVVQDFFRSCCGRSLFFIFHGYFRFLPLVPVFEAVRVWSIGRGLRKGRARVYDSSI